MQLLFVSLLLPIYLGKVKLHINKQASKTFSGIDEVATIFEHDMFGKQVDTLDLLESVPIFGYC